MALIAGGVHEIAVLYQAMLDARNIGPRECDEMYLWECAVALGVLADPVGEKANEAQRKSRSVDLIRQRLARAADPTLPEPDVQPVSAEQLARMGDFSRAGN